MSYLLSFTIKFSHKTVFVVLVILLLQAAYLSQPFLLCIYPPTSTGAIDVNIAITVWRLRRFLAFSSCMVSAAT